MTELGAMNELERHDLDSLGIYFVSEVAEERSPRGKLLAQAQPAHVRLMGAIGGVRCFSDPARLRIEAERLLNAAQILEAHQAATSD